MRNPEEEFNIKGAAAEMNVAVKTITRWIKKGELQAERRGPKVYRIKRKHIDDMKRRYALKFN